MTTRTVSIDDALRVVIAMHRLMRSLRRSSNTGSVHPTQLIVLALLAQHGPMRVGALAERVPCSQPTATTAVAGLEEAGLVQREPDPRDGRATHVVATTAGEETMRSFARCEAEALADKLSELPPEDLELLLDATPVLAALAEQPVRAPR
ncbi:MarR family winged helix-turn-helix transcriptional regulator [Amycolatopsis sp. CA-230715]|uniref:MarR family winged helix-turn-helix transcriptional regulator n=1 Tax=Amycolatopsis sp. CA-230715 TaxID=2745196 RepID=UPI001C00E27D|nr:MarR family transcriptional regulator [Amycolatopsis sp. CA-230715]QWF78838.1 putative HTH-type transcriptional regulator [Amycolatopsis sp. CA-230715]